MATKKKINWRAYKQKLINRGKKLIKRGKKLINKGAVTKLPRLTTSSRQLEKSELKLSEGKEGKRSRKAKEDVYVTVDSAGLKIFKEEEWKLRRNTHSKRQTWKKLRLSVDKKDSDTIFVSLTDNSS